MPERNLCKEAGCSAACCRDVYFADVYFVRKVLNVFPEAKKVRDITKPIERGVYYDNFLGTATVRIAGTCPHLNSDGNCSIYGRRLKGCEDLSIGSDNCVFFRRVWEQELKIHS